MALLSLFHFILSSSIFYVQLCRFYMGNANSPQRRPSTGSSPVRGTPGNKRGSRSPGSRDRTTPPRRVRNDLPRAFDGGGGSAPALPDRDGEDQATPALDFSSWGAALRPSHGVMEGIYGQAERMDSGAARAAPSGMATTGERGLAEPTEAAEMRATWATAATGGGAKAGSTTGFLATGAATLMAGNGAAMAAVTGRSAGAGGGIWRVVDSESEDEGGDEYEDGDEDSGGGGSGSGHGGGGVGHEARGEGGEGGGEGGEGGTGSGVSGMLDLNLDSFSFSSTNKQNFTNEQLHSLAMRKEGVHAAVSYECPAACSLGGGCMERVSPGYHDVKQARSSVWAKNHKGDWTLRGYKRVLARRLQQLVDKHNRVAFSIQGVVVCLYSYCEYWGISETLAGTCVGNVALPAGASIRYMHASLTCLCLFPHSHTLRALSFILPMRSHFLMCPPRRPPASPIPYLSPALHHTHEQRMHGRWQ